MTFLNILKSLQFSDPPPTLPPKYKKKAREIVFIEMLMGGRTAPPIIPLIQQGNQRVLRDTFRTASGASLDNAHTFLAFGKSCPPNAAETYSMLLDSGIKTAPMFRIAAFMGSMTDNVMEECLWTGAHRAQNPDSVALHARVLAEYLRYRLGRDGSYRIAPENLFAEKKGRSASMDYMKAVQHALVDHVATEGAELPLNRGAAVLHELRGGIEGSDIWTHKLAEVKARRFSLNKDVTLTFDKR